MVLTIGIFFFIGSFAFLYLVSAGVHSESALTAARALPVFLAFCVLYFAWRPITPIVFDSLGYIFLQRILNIGWLLLVLGVLLMITANLWLPILLSSKEAEPTSAITPLAVVLLVAAFYGFWVRSQVDNPLTTTFIDNPLVYRFGVTRTVYLFLFSAVFALMAMLSALVKTASTSSGVSLTGTYILCTAVMIVVALFSSVFHIPLSAANIARTLARRALQLEGVFFLGEPIKRFQKIIGTESKASISEKQLGDMRGRLKDMLRETFASIEHAEVATAKIPIPASLNLRFGEKEVHKYIQISMPVHAGVIKAFVSLRSVGNKYVAGCSMYFLGEESPQALLRNSFQIIRLYLYGCASNATRQTNETRESLSDDNELPILPRIKPAAEIDVLTRANRDEIVDETTGILWLTLSDVIKKFEQNFIDSNGKATTNGA